MAWWIMPAIAGGVLMFSKSKKSAAFRWFEGTEEQAKSLSPVLLLSKVLTGDQLPLINNEKMWKPIKLSLAISPFSAPDELEVYVYAPLTEAGSGVTGYVTLENLSNFGRHGGGHHGGGHHGGGHHGGHHGGGGYYGGPYYPYVEPLVIEAVPLAGYVVSWVAKDGTAQSVTKATEAEARALKATLASQGITATITYGGTQLSGYSFGRLA